MWTSLEGILIGGRYEVCRHLATGGMAAVFQGWDHRLERPVAIKVLRQLEHANAGSIARFQREAHAAAMLSHPHVVRAYDFFEEDGCHYLVMEYVEGANLKQHLKRRGPMPEREALRLAGQVASALCAAHAHGFVHRDIKPQNIMVDARGTAKVTDFGIVHITRGATLTSDGVVLGTADYIAPEQARGEELTPATDVYALGVVLYEMLTGRLPFTGRTPMAVAALHATAPLVPPRRIRPGLSRHVDALVVRALRKHPAERYITASVMLAAIRGALHTLEHPQTSGGILDAEREERERVAISTCMVRDVPGASHEGQEGISGPDASGAVLAEVVEMRPSRVDDRAGGAMALVGGDAWMMTMEHRVAPAWVRMLVVATAALTLLAGTLALDIWMRAHGAAAGFFPLP